MCTGEKQNREKTQRAKVRVEVRECSLKHDLQPLKEKVQAAGKYWLVG